MSIAAAAFLCLVLAAPSEQQGVVEIGGPVLTQSAQDEAPPPAVDAPDLKPPTPEHTGFGAIVAGVADDIKHLPSRQSLLLAGIGGALAAAAHPFDDTVNAHALSHYDTLNRIFAPAKYYGDTPEQLAFSIGTWALGRAMDMPRMSHLGMDLIRAQIVTEILVEPIKLATHRERPDGSNAQSFPSGHAAATFAFAAVVERHLGWRRSLWAYGIASYVAASRLHDNRHYLSDVVFGAAVGSVAGRTVTRHGRDTWTLGPMAVPGGGVALAVTRTAF